MRDYKILFCQGGLGDHLAMSTMPEEWTKMGYDVFLSLNNVHRNLEIHDLVWKLNPYIKGYKDEYPSYHITLEEGIKLNEERKLYGWGFIESMEMKHGILNTGNVFPKIYREHNLIPELKDKTIVNFQSITQNYEENHVLEVFNRIIQDYNIQEENILELEIQIDVNQFGNNFHSNSKVSNIPTNYKKFQISSIFEHCDVIYSCKNYVSLHSGASVLASAVNNCETFVIMSQDTKYAYDTNNFVFPNQKYIF